MSRHRSPLIAHRHDARLRRVQALKAEHPFCGYRRLWAYLRFVEQWPMNKKRVLHLMREYHLVAPPTLKLKAKRTPTGSKPRATKPHECWGIDMTKRVVEGFGWVSIVVGLDWYTKKLVGHYISQSCLSKYSSSKKSIQIPSSLLPIYWPRGYPWQCDIGHLIVTRCTKHWLAPFGHGCQLTVSKRHAGT
jgi:hypothetical protein